MTNVVQFSIERYVRRTRCKFDRHDKLQLAILKEGVGGRPRKWTGAADDGQSLGVKEG